MTLPRLLAALTLTLAETLALTCPARAEDIPFTPTPSLWRETMGTVKADVRDIIRYPADHPQQTAKVVAGIAVLVLLDKPLTQFYQNRIEPIFQGFHLPQAPWTAEDYGIMSEDVWLLTGLAGSYAWGKISGDDRPARAALMSAKGLAYSYITSQLVLKTVFGRKRPYEDLDNPEGNPNVFTDDPGDFFAWEGSFLRMLQSGRSMPSYHFTEYFVVARIYSGVYDDALWPYAVMGTLAVSNIQNHHHWVSDMVAGSFIGYGIGSIILKNDAAWRAGRLTATPVVTPDGAGVTLGMQF